MKYRLAFVVLIFYPYFRKINGVTTESVNIEIRLWRPINNKWGLNMYPIYKNTKKNVKPVPMREQFSNMQSWKNGIYSTTRALSKNIRYKYVKVWTSSGKIVTIKEVRLVFAEFVHIYRCAKLCKTNKIIPRFEVICSLGFWRSSIYWACKPCKNGYWGENCANKCGCVRAGCDKVDGNCINWGGCKWRLGGVGCSITCPDAYFMDPITKECSKRCHCYDNSECDIETGKCRDDRCDVNFYGAPLCQKRCLYGQKCLWNCHCRNDAMCDGEYGFCPTGCSLRYVGYDCSKYCLPGFYGPSCKKKCRCALPDQCNATNGNCLMGGCDDSYFGINCDKKCPLNSKIPECTRRCFCKDFVSCGTDRKCPGKCHVRYYGTACDHTCPAYKYIINGHCVGDCTCISAISCRVTDGLCLKPKCSVGWFGKDCAGECHCLDPQQCDMDTGYCFDKKCESAQYYGLDCQLSCNADFYIVDGKCTGICHCLNNTKCNVLDGHCVDKRCAPGYMGERCQIECRDGYFGTNCKFICHCKFNLACDRRNGFCDLGCMYGYAGIGCQTASGYTDVIIQAVIWFLVLIVLVSLSGLVSVFIFKDKTKRRNKTLKLVDSLKRRGYSVTSIRRESVKVDNQDTGQRRKMTLTGIRGTQRLPSKTSTRKSQSYTRKTSSHPSRSNSYQNAQKEPSSFRLASSDGKSYTHQKRKSAKPQKTSSIHMNEEIATLARGRSRNSIVNSDFTPLDPSDELRFRRSTVMNF